MSSSAASVPTSFDSTSVLGSCPGGGGSGVRDGSLLETLASCRGPWRKLLSSRQWAWLHPRMEASQRQQQLRQQQQQQDAQAATTYRLTYAYVGWQTPMSTRRQRQCTPTRRRTQPHGLRAQAHPQTQTTE